MLDRFTEQFLEDEALTAGLSDEDASELVGWLSGIAEDLEQQPRLEQDRYLAHLKRLGRELARVSRQFKIPVDELIELVEVAWEEPGDETKPMQA